MTPEKALREIEKECQQVQLYYADVRTFAAHVLDIITTALEGPKEATEDPPKDEDACPHCGKPCDVSYEAGWPIGHWTYTCHECGITATYSNPQGALKLLACDWPITTNRGVDDLMYSMDLVVSILKPRKPKGKLTKEDTSIFPYWGHPSQSERGKPQIWMCPGCSTTFDDCGVLEKPTDEPLNEKGEWWPQHSEWFLKDGKWFHNHERGYYEGKPFSPSKGKV